jgi:hypothetical protein
MPKNLGTIQYPCIWYFVNIIFKKVKFLLHIYHHVTHINTEWNLDYNILISKFIS